MTKVNLRRKPVTGGRQTLYLDYYPPILHPTTGKRTRREFLKLFLFDEIEHEEQPYTDEKGCSQRRIIPVLDKEGKGKKVKLNELQRQHNKDTLALAEAIKAKRQLAVQRGDYGFLSVEKENTDFVRYFESLARRRSGSNSDNWYSALQYLQNFTKNAGIRFKDLSETFCNDFRHYLLTTASRKSAKARLAQNSAVSYFNKFKAALKQAYKEDYLETDLNVRVSSIKPTETERQFLTLEELQKLAETGCPSTVLRKVALFSALTGLRFSDIQKLVWSELHHDSRDGYIIRFRQKKTKGVETLPISDQAAGLLGERGGPSEPVFKNLHYTLTQTELPKWLKQAGIFKAITFHSFRHTYATLQISLGTDLYTVSKMLGHREIKTTQVYAKIIDKQKREAAGKIKLNL